MPLEALYKSIANSATNGIGGGTGLIVFFFIDSVQARRLYRICKLAKGIMIAKDVHIGLRFLIKHNLHLFYII